MDALLEITNERGEAVVTIAKAWGEMSMLQRGLALSELAKFIDKENKKNPESHFTYKVVG